MTKLQTPKQALKLSETAANRIKEIMADDQKGAIGLRVGINNAGCSGHSYFIEYAYDQKDFEEVVEDRGVKLFIDPKSIMYLIGTEMDYTEDKMGAHFTFNNPNEAGRCGCGVSFSVER